MEKIAFLVLSAFKHSACSGKGKKSPCRQRETRGLLNEFVFKKNTQRHWF